MTQQRGKAKLPELSADWILARAYEDGAGHLIWKGYSQNDNPKANCGEASGGRPFNVRRAIWKCMHGREPRSDGVVVAECGVPNCIEPGCLQQMSYGHRLAGRVMPLAHREAIARARRGQSPLGEEGVSIVRSERMKPESERPTQDELAQRLGVSQDTISNIETGRSWRDYRSPFSGLMR